MQAAAFEATFPIMGGLTWQRTFHAMYATPISPRDIVLGNVAWIAIRLTLISTIFTIVMTLFGAAASPLIVLAIPAAVLTGLAFATPIAAFSATQRTPEKFNALFRFGITPLFLFSGTFFPISNLPPLLQPLAWLSPLWHGVEPDPRPGARDDPGRAAARARPRGGPDVAARPRRTVVEPGRYAVERIGWSRG